MIGTEVYLWGSRIGTIVQQTVEDIPRFMYDKNFLKSNIEVSPIMMPLSEQVYSFPGLSEQTFRGLPGMFADSLPDKFGTRMMDGYLARQGRSAHQLTAVERLCYVGKRGMGALEYIPQKGMDFPDKSINIDDLAQIAEEVLSNRMNFRIKADNDAMDQLIKVGTSAGGARAKALIAWNEDTMDIRSGQIDAGKGYSYWLLKFGTISNNKDKDKEADTKEYARIEYAYYLMAKDAGILMSDCRLIETEQGTHFATKRFDREDATGRKVHMQSLGGLAHYDFNHPGENSYEQTAQIMRRLHLSQKETEQLFRRMVFNEVAKNYDDHVKNISFLMNRQGKWSLAPAYDMTFSYNPNSIWTSKHQMQMNGKRSDILLDDIVECGKSMDITDRKIKEIVKQVICAVQKWSGYAETAGLDERCMQQIGEHHRHDLNP